MRRVRRWKRVPPLTEADQWQEIDKRGREGRVGSGRPSTGEGGRGRLEVLERQKESSPFFVSKDSKSGRVVIIEPEQPDPAGEEREVGRYALRERGDIDKKWKLQEDGTIVR